MDFMTAVKTCIMQKFTCFEGRARRSEFWYFYLATFAANALLGWIPVLGWIISIGLMIPYIAVGARRLHDTGRSGWLQLLMLIPLVGAIILIVFWAGDSKPGANKWGENPKGF